MNLLTREALDKLIEIGDEKCISIYMPMEKITIDADKSKIRFKNLLKAAEKKLTGSGIDPADAEKFLTPGFNLLNDNDFWLKPSESMALFLDASGIKVFHLPYDTGEILDVGIRYYILPLLRMFSERNAYHVIAISQEKVRLLACDMLKCTEIELSGFPLGIEEALQYDDFQKGHQFNIRGTKSSSEGTPGVFRGHGDGKEDHKNNLARFLEIVDDGLAQFIKSKEIPVILAGVEYVTAIFRKLNSTFNLLDAEILGNPDIMTPKDFFEKASPVARLYFEGKLKKELKNYSELVSSDMASDDLEKVASAAFNGKVRTLFVPTGISRPGIFNQELDSAILKKENDETEDLLNFAASQTLRTGGKVYIIPQENIPNGKDCAAVYRY